MSNEKKWNPELWKPVGFEPIQISPHTEIGEKRSFLDYQAPEDRYEVRGVMPKAPKHEKE